MRIAASHGAPWEAAYSADIKYGIYEGNGFVRSPLLYVYFLVIYKKEG